MRGLLSNTFYRMRSSLEKIPGVLSSTSFFFWIGINFHPLRKRKKFSLDLACIKHGDEFSSQDSRESERVLMWKQFYKFMARSRRDCLVIYICEDMENRSKEYSVKSRQENCLVLYVWKRRSEGKCIQWRVSMEVCAEESTQWSVPVRNRVREMFTKHVRREMCGGNSVKEVEHRHVHQWTVGN